MGKREVEEALKRTNDAGHVVIVDDDGWAVLKAAGIDFSKFKIERIPPGEFNPEGYAAVVICGESDGSGHLVFPTSVTGTCAGCGRGIVFHKRFDRPDLTRLCGVCADGHMRKN